MERDGQGCPILPTVIERQKMKWLTKKQIKARSKTIKGAIEVSIEHHQQLAGATLKELLDGIDGDKASLGKKHCGLCQHFTGEFCKPCPLSSQYYDCCKEYEDVREIWWCIVLCCSLSANRKTHPQFIKAEKKLIKRLKKELKKVENGKKKTRKGVK